MKAKDLNKINLEDIDEKIKSYILINNIIEKNNDEEEIEKCLLDTSSLASKQSLLSLSNQQTKIIKALQNIVAKQNELENLIKNSSVKNISEKLNEIEQKINDNIIE